VITKTFVSFEKFKKQFSETGKTRVGSGWAWLSIDNKVSNNYKPKRRKK